MSMSSLQRGLHPPESFDPPAPPSSRSPSSQSSDRKRKRDASVTTASTRFTESTRSHLLSLYGSECWLCSANTRLDSCHVIGQKDRGFFLYRQAGLLPFDSLADIDNAVPLCPTCYREFDDAQCPGFIFFPSNIQFFIDFERQDFERRCRWATDGHESPARVCPSAEQYHTGALGLYERIVLQNYFPRLGNEASDVIGALQPRSWHGSPMASLMRTFLILGSPVLGGAITQEQRALLRELQDLYLRPDPAPQQAGLYSTISYEPFTSVAAQTSDLGVDLARAQDNQAGASHTSRPGQETHTPRPADSAVDVETVYYGEGRSLEQLSCHSAGAADRWSWGPKSTSQDKAEWLPRMMGQSVRPYLSSS